MKDGILRPAGDDLDEIQANQKVAAQQIEAYFTDAVNDRKKNKGDHDDILTLFLGAEIDGQRLTMDEIVGICFLFILAGLDTVTDSLECFFAYLAQHPDQRRRIVNDPSIIPSAVEELLRWETPVTAVPRLATKDIDLGGCPIKKGDNIGVSIGAANTDDEGPPGCRHRGPHPEPEQAPRLRGWHPPVPRVPSGPIGTADHPAGMASADS